MVTAQQLRAARNALRWSIEELSKRSSVSVRTIITIEAADSAPPVKPSTIQKLKTALETAGIEFIGTPDDRPGIRIGLPKPNDGSS